MTNTKKQLVSYIMSNIVLVLCSDDIAVPVDLESIKDTCPPVLARFLGIGLSQFSDPSKDEQGRLTFAKTFGISQYQFALIVAFCFQGMCRTWTYWCTHSPFSRATMNIAAFKKMITLPNISHDIWQC